MTLDELFPVTAEREHVRRVVTGHEQPRMPELEDFPPDDRGVVWIIGWPFR